MGCRLAALSEPGARGGRYSRSYAFVSTTLLTLFAQGRPPFFVELLQVLSREPFEVVVGILPGARKRIELSHGLFVVFGLRIIASFFTTGSSRTRHLASVCR
jgi:hypothetical protein